MAPHEQVDSFVIRYMTGDAEPLPYIWIEPVSKPNIEAEIAVDNHLMSAGVRLSKWDMLQRYGRAKADPDDPDSVPTARHGVGARTDGGMAWTPPHPWMDATPYAGRASGRGGAGARRGALFVRKYRWVVLRHTMTGTLHTVPHTTSGAGGACHKIRNKGGKVWARRSRFDLVKT